MEPPPPHCVLRGHAAEVMAARFGARDANGLPLLFSASSDGELRAWSLRTHRPVASVVAHAGSSVLAIHALGGERVLSQGRDGVARVWDARDGLRGPLVELPVQSYNFCGCAVSAAAAAAANWEGEAACEASQLLALPTADANQVLLWDVRQRAPLPLLLSAAAEQQQQPGGKGAGMCMCLRFVGEQRLLAGWEDGSLRLFDLRRAATPLASQAVHAEPVLCLDGPADHTAVVSGSADRLVAVSPLRPSLGAPSARLAVPATGETDDHGGVQALSVRPDGRLLASGGWDRRVRLWQWGKWKPLAVLRHHTGTVNAVHFSACSRYLASASNDKTLAIWTLFPPKT